MIRANLDGQFANRQVEPEASASETGFNRAPGDLPHGCCSHGPAFCDVTVQGVLYRRVLPETDIIGLVSTGDEDGLPLSTISTTLGSPEFSLSSDTIVAAELR